MKGLLGIAGPIVLGTMLSGALRRRGGNTGMFGNMGGGFLSNRGMMPGGGFGSLIGMLSEGGFRNTGGLFGRVLRGGF